ncbi:hypothetical protein [Adlercreutzia sp. ZJ141]|uniref:hypothetical protein n=1 Tax=Adlercreutzia sp. ZJ141 TaxID=2709406 RepID=UPI0013EB982A|nr:hypothetical protein [Adlercreutzia sp. ZJ141]
MNSEIRVVSDEEAIAAVVQNISEGHVQSGEMEYECPECGKPIKITGFTNVCECGFILDVTIGE